MFKKIFCLFCLVLSILSLTSCDVGIKRASLEDFEYEHGEYAGLVLTKYNGSLTKLKVKSIYDSTTVSGITKDTFSFNENIEEIVLDDVGLPPYAFEGCTNLRKVKLRNVDFVGDYAFKGCVNLETIEMEGTLTYLSSLAFLDCHKLTKTNMFGGSFTSYNDNKKKEIYEYDGNNTLVLGTDGIHGDSVTDIRAIGEYAFYGRDALISLTIPTTVTRIGKFAFGNCKNLARISVERNHPTYDSRDNCNAVIETNTDKLIVGCQNTIIPNDIQIIGEYAFADCFYLNGINIPTSVKTIEDFAFIGCTGLQTINVSSNNLIYDSRDNSNAIIETSNNRLVLASNNTIIPSSVETIASYAFSNVNMANVIIPEGVKTIEAYAFADMTNLTSITLPSTLESIDPTAFSGCNNLMQIIVNSNNKVYDSRNNANAVIETETNKLVVTCQATTIPNSVEVIGEKAFANSNTLQTVTIPSSVKLIEAKAFADCSNLEFVTFSEGLVEIKEEAFANCVKVTSFNLPNTLTTVGEKAFINMKAMDTLKVPKGLTIIGFKAFSGWLSLINIIVDVENPKYYSSASAALVEKDTNSLVLGCGHTTISEDITSIKAYAFDGSKLKYIMIPKTLTNIETAAFAGCTYLVQIEVDENHTLYEDRGLNAILEKETGKMLVGCKKTTFDRDVKVIGSHAFEGSGLLSMNLNLYANGNLEKIEEYAFANCESLSYLEIGKNVKYIESHAFAGSDGLYVHFAWRLSVPDTFAEDWNSTNCLTNIS